MSRTPVTVDRLRERLLAKELGEARYELDAAGPEALVARAHALLAELRAVRARFDTLEAALVTARAPERRALVATYLRETTAAGASLERDLRALRLGKREVLDAAALAERQAKVLLRLERGIEARLAVARFCEPWSLAAPTADALLALSAEPGRWSRRVEALRLLARSNTGKLGPEEHRRVVSGVARLASPLEQRWVQPAAIVTWAAFDRAGALAYAELRFAQPASGEDFIARAAIVAAVVRLRKRGFESVVRTALSDASELVRLTAARAARDESALERMAGDDRSVRVRATALARLARLRGARGLDALARALVQDSSELVVSTAQAELVRAVRRDPHGSARAARTALFTAAGRGELPAGIRSECADALAEIDVLCSDHTLLVTLAAAAHEVPVGGKAYVPLEPALLQDEQRLGRVLAVLARDDFGIGLESRRSGVVLHRGERSSFAAWRLWFELSHPVPSKRQGFDHASARRLPGAIRAAAGGLAEVTATRVPGARVLTAAGDWGRALPLVEDFLSLEVLRARPVVLASSFGLTRLVPPRNLTARVKAWLKLSRHYERFATLRERALASEEGEVQASYVSTLARETGITLEVTPFAYDLTGGPSALALPGTLAPAVGQASHVGALALLPFTPTLDGGASGFAGPLAALNQLAEYALSPSGNRLPHLTTYALLLLGGMLIRAAAVRHAVEADRRSIPLVIGGWGTRGKSGTERLKGAMLQGVGYEALIKTTGCEAMFIHAVPGLKAREVFIYRPYDKATVWEQRELLRLARRFGVDVFLWECMALQPDLVNLLQAQWMADDYSTITNAYPDHEDVQGPTGMDVAATIGEFVPTRGQLFTAEQQMLPILRERARARATTLTRVTPRDADLISGELLARFPHREHPRNVALAAALGAHLGIPRLVAITEMADNLVPDLGVLRTYPSLEVKGRTVTFTNGMGANDRAGTLGNWERAGFAGSDDDPARFVVTLVNNRADRVARSEVFAKILVEDLGAHRHVLIGTNVSGLLVFIDAALGAHLRALTPSRDLPASPEGRLEVASARIAKAFARLRVEWEPGRVLRRCDRMGLALEPEFVERLLEPEAASERYSDACDVVRSALGDRIDAEQRPFAIALLAQARLVRGLFMLARSELERAPERVDTAFAAAYEAVFRASLVPLHDAALTGDQIMEHIAASVPPGCEAAIMGMQNIKGTGLDFVYRWVSADQVTRLLAELDSAAFESRERALLGFMVHDDYGRFDAALALREVERRRASDPAATTLPYEPALRKLRDVVARRAASASTVGKQGRLARARKALRATFDFADAIGRRRSARRVVDDLVDGRISHATAATLMRGIVARQKR